MANIAPLVKDLSDGKTRYPTSSDTLTNEDGTAINAGGGGSGGNEGFIEGLLWNRSGNSIITLGTGRARDENNSVTIDLSSEASVSLNTGHGGGGLGQVNGLDVRALDVADSITVSQTTTTITASASILPSFPQHSLSGTITSVGTALTGSAAARFLAELKVGDLVLTSSNGASRITAVASNSAATLVAAFPGGDVTGDSGSRIEQATIQPNDAASDRISTISANGLSIVVPTSATHAASSPCNIGVELDGGDQWFAIWLISNGTTPGGFFSTQRTTLLAAPSGYTQLRRFSWARNNSSATLFQQRSFGRGNQRRVIFQNDSRNLVLSSGAVEGAWTPVDCSEFVPPTSIRPLLFAVAFASAVQNQTYSFRGRNLGSSGTTNGRATQFQSGDSTITGLVSAPFETECDQAQFIDYFSPSVTGTVNVDIGARGWVEWV